MSDRRLLVSTSAARRRDAAAAWLGERLRGGRLAGGRLAGGGALVVAPSRGAADDVVRELATAGGVVLGVDRVTLPQLAAELATARLAADGAVTIGGLGVEALLARVVARAAAEGELDYFLPVVDTPGLPRALARTLGELRAAGAGPADLAAAGPPGHDLARLLALYEDELATRGLVDRAGLLAAAVASLAEGAESPLLGRPLLLLDLAVDSHLEERLLAATVARAPAVLATAVAGDDEATAALGRLVAAPGDLDAAAPDTAGRLERLRRTLFASLPETEPTADDGGVVFLSAPGEARECVEIARRARDLAAGGLAFDRMAVLLRDPDLYLPLVEEAFTRAGVPIFTSRGSMRPDPAGRAFLALLACAGERLTASRFAEYLSLAQAPTPDADGAPRVEEVPWVEPEGEQLVLASLFAAPADETTDETVDETVDADALGDDAPVVAGTLRTPRHWERLLVDAAVIGGRERWQRRLDGLDREIALRLLQTGEEDPARDELLRRRRDLDRLARFALPVIDELADLTEAETTWGDWRQRLERLAALALRRPEKVLTVLAELRPMDEVGGVDLDEVRRTLEERLTFLRTEPPDRRYGHVFVAAVEEARGRAFDVVFLPGLAEGIFPRRASEDPLLLDEHRRRLAVPLLTGEERVERERLLLRIAVGAARRELVVSYPSMDPLHGRSRVPSFYALDVLRAAEGRIPDLRELESRAAAGSGSALGWPAPAEPAAAVDDAEYDLALIQSLRRGAGRGRGRYLLAVNEHLDRSLRARWHRWSRTFGPADGLLAEPGPGREALSRHGLRNRAYSPTALQKYAACPYQFLLSAVLRLRPRDEPEPLEQLDPLTRGSLFHEVQAELLRELRDEDLLPMREDALGELQRRADAAFSRVADRYRDQLAPAIPRVWESEMNGLRIDLHGWIHAVARSEDGFRPAWFELSFGLAEAAGGDRPDRDAASFAAEAVVADGVRLRGSIDLVETDAAGALLRVTDHKTGRPYGRRDLRVGGGEVLQPLLYALAAEQHLERPVASGRLFFCTRRGGYEVREVAIDDEGRRAVAGVLGEIDRAVGEGFLPAAPRQDACRWCDFRLVCGPLEELRTKRKNPQLLVPLARLRKQP